MGELDFDRLIAQLSKKSQTTPHMVKAMVELTYGCNLRCVHCYNPTHQAENELSTEQVFRILEELAAQGCLWVGFTGGELFTRRDAFEIMRYANSLGLVVTILTNATMITPELADEIKAVDPYRLEISVYGATAETYEKVTRVPGSYPRFVRGADLLHERGLSMLLKLVLMNLNVHELGAVREFAQSRKLPYKVSTEIHPKVDGSMEPLAYRLSPEQAFEVWRQMIGEAQLTRRAKPAAQGDDDQTAPLEDERCGSAGCLFDCLCGKTSATVTPHGKMNLCVSIYHPLYDLTTGSIREGWKTLVDLVASTKPGPEYECQRCSVAQHCTRGSSDGWLEHRAFDSPCIPYFRDVAERKARFLGTSLAP